MLHRPSGGSRDHSKLRRTPYNRAMEMQQTDVVLIGAGPIGIEMAAALKGAQVDYLHFDAGQIGHTVSWFAPGTRFFSSNERIAVAGVPLRTPDQGKATREAYLAYLRMVVELHDLAIETYTPVKDIVRQPGGDFVVTVEPVAGRRQVRAKRIILATGGTAWPRRLGIPGEDLPHVSHYFQEPHAYFRRRVLIVGGKNSAVEAALRCYHAGAQVTLSYRRAALNPKSIKYWLLPEINGLMESGKIAAHFETVPVEITPRGVELAPTDPATLAAGPGRRVAVEADHVLLLVGYEADMSLCRMAGVELHGDCQAPVHDPVTMQTNVPGVYVAGTAVAGTQDRYRLFIENCHVHVERILAHLTGQIADAPEPVFERPES